jgi:hypothetical protein
MAAVSDRSPAREVLLPGHVALPAVVPLAGDAPLEPTESELQRAAIRRTLAHHAGKTADAKVIAAATLSIWTKMVTRLAPVIGVRGVDVLFRRALHLTQNDFAWLAIAGGAEKEDADLLANIKERLEGCEAEVAIEASYTLLVTFTELLTALIGESLVGRLFDPVWGPSSPASEEISA